MNKEFITRIIIIHVAFGAEDDVVEKTHSN